MARDHARIRCRIWADDDFRALTPRAQLVYLTALSQPSTSYCGVVNITVNRLARLADGDQDATRTALAELQSTRFVYVDEDTEELLIRSFVRNDGVISSPNVLKRMVADFEAIMSRSVAAAFLHEWHTSCVALVDVQGFKEEVRADVVRALEALPDAPEHDPWKPFEEGMGEGLPEGIEEGFSRTLPDADFGKGSGIPSGKGSIARAASPPHPPTPTTTTPPARAREDAEPVDNPPSDPPPGGKAIQDPNLEIAVGRIEAGMPPDLSARWREDRQYPRVERAAAKLLAAGWTPTELAAHVDQAGWHGIHSPAGAVTTRLAALDGQEAPGVTHARRRTAEDDNHRRPQAEYAEAKRQRERLDARIDALPDDERQALAEKAAAEWTLPCEPDLANANVRAMARSILAAQETSP